MSKRPSSRAAAMRLLLCVAGVALVTKSSQAQRIPITGQAEPVLADRKIRQRLKDAKEFFAAKKFDAAFRVVQPVLDAPADGFVALDGENAAKATTFRSVRAEVDLLIAKQPDEAKKIYQRLYGADADRLFEQAVLGDDMTKLRSVVRRYFHTTAGAKAAYRLGSYLLTTGQSSASALVFTRLLQSSSAKDFEPNLSLRLAIAWRDAGRVERSEKVLANLVGKEFTVAGQKVTVPEAAKSLAWLKQVGGERSIAAGLSTEAWLAFRGGPNRNPRLEKAPATDEKVVSWSASVLIDPLKAPGETAETHHDKRLQQIVANLKPNRRELPALVPLVVGDLVFFRTAGNLMCYRLSTGKRVWQSMSDPDVEDLLEAYAAADPKKRRGPRKPIPPRRYGLEQLLSHRMWRDVNWGTMSSDGQRLFVVEEPGSVIQYNPWTVPGQGWKQPPQQNLLVAYDLRPGPTFGQRLWEAGGEKGDPLFENPVAGHFFLSAPLVVDGRLYTLGDQNGEVRLVVIDASNGHELWSQPLAVSPSAIRFDFIRRTCGAGVAFADGVLVCQTGTGLVVAVNPVSRSLLWGYRLPKLPQGGGGFPRPFPNPNPNARQNTWSDAVPTISEGRVFVTPMVLRRPGHELCALDLLTGKLLWSQGDAHVRTEVKSKDLSTDALYLAGVVNDLAIVVARDRVRAYETATGKVKWTLTSGFQTPSGRGVIVGKRILIPTAKGELQVIDAATGKQQDSVEIPGGKLGNLLLARGALISQTVDRLRVVKLPKLTP